LLDRGLDDVSQPRGDLLAVELVDQLDGDELAVRMWIADDAILAAVALPRQYALCECHVLNPFGAVLEVLPFI
jgi:hypothetical protein